MVYFCYIDESGTPQIPGFEQMSYEDRRSEVIKQRKDEIFRAMKQNNSKALKQLKKLQADRGLHPFNIR